MPTEPIAVESVVEVPRPERPTLYVACGVFEDGSWGGNVSSRSVEDAAEWLEAEMLSFAIIPASDAPPPVKRMTEAECRERAEKFIDEWIDSTEFRDGLEEFAVAFARECGIVEGT